MSLETLADKILEGVDYDIYKEDLEEREILGYIEQSVSNYIDQLNTPATAISFKSESADTYLFVSSKSTSEEVLEELATQWWATEDLYLQDINTNLDGITAFTISDVVNLA